MPLVNPLVSVIILNYNGESYLTDCIDSVLKNQYPNFEVILVDNASTDHSLRIAQDIFAGDQRLHIIQNEKNLGYSGGNNVGFEHCSGKYVLFLNNDTTVAPDWLTPLVDAMENDPTIGVAQSLIYSIDGKKVQSAGWLFSNYLLKKHRLCEDKPSSTAFEPVFEISFACGASLIVRRDILENMGAFDYNAPFFYDDTLISLKSMLAGKRVVTISGSKMYHVSGATNVWKIRFTTKNLMKANTILLFDIYHKKADLVKALLFNGLFLFNTLIFIVNKKETAAVFGVLDAFAWSLRNFRFIWKNRLNHWSKTKVSPRALKENFVRINLPVAFYLFPSKLTNDHFLEAVRRYENAIIKH